MSESAGPAGFGRVEDDGTLKFFLYDPNTQSSVRDANGFHVLAIPQALTSGKPCPIAVHRKKGVLQLQMGPAATRRKAEVILNTPLSGDPAYLGDFPGDAHWGEGFNIHQGMTGRLRGVRFGGEG